MSRRKLGLVGLAAAVVAFSGGYSHADLYSANFSGFQEAPSAILSGGEGTLTLDVGADSIAYELTYSGLTSVTQSHIHFGRNHVAGGVMAYLCTNVGGGPAGTPACPSSSGTVSGTLTAASIVGPTAQGVTVGDFTALLDALEHIAAYGNIHTSAFSSGEIRGQLLPEYSSPSDGEQDGPAKRKSRR